MLKSIDKKNNHLKESSPLVAAILESTPNNMDCDTLSCQISKVQVQLITDI